MRLRSSGWKHESARHSLAARGVKTGRYSAVKRYSFGSPNPLVTVKLLTGADLKRAQAKTAEKERAELLRKRKDEDRLFEELSEENEEIQEKVEAEEKRWPTVSVSEPVRAKKSDYPVERWL